MALNEDSQEIAETSECPRGEVEMLDLLMTKLVTKLEELRLIMQALLDTQNGG